MSSEPLCKRRREAEPHARCHGSHAHVPWAPAAPQNKYGTAPAATLPTGDPPREKGDSIEDKLKQAAPVAYSFSHRLNDRAYGLAEDGDRAATREWFRDGKGGRANCIEIQLAPGSRVLQITMFMVIAPEANATSSSSGSSCIARGQPEEAGTVLITSPRAIDGRHKNEHWAAPGDGFHVLRAHKHHAPDNLADARGTVRIRPRILSLHTPAREGVFQFVLHVRHASSGGTPSVLVTLPPLRVLSKMAARKLAGSHGISAASPSEPALELPVLLECTSLIEALGDRLGRLEGQLRRGAQRESGGATQWTEAGRAERILDEQHVLLKSAKARLKRVRSSLSVATPALADHCSAGLGSSPSPDLPRFDSGALARESTGGDLFRFTSGEVTFPLRHISGLE